MEHHSSDISDPIEAKLRDSDMVDRVVRGAVVEAVEKARRLGFLDERPDLSASHVPGAEAKGKN